MISRLCYGCMEYIMTSDECPLCGYKNDVKPESIIALESGILLNERYIIGKVIGYGGFSITYIAWDNILETKVAIKEFMPFGLSNREVGKTTVILNFGKYQENFNKGINQFIEEAKMLSRLKNVPAISEILNYFEENNTAYIVMPYYKGETLSEYLKKSDGKISTEKCLEIMIPILEALAFVHKEEIIHRDVSPDNILITEDNNIKLLDFGASRSYANDIDISVNKYTVMLKHGYAPPEQYYRMGVQGVWTDIYASAATIYHCITGDMPTFSIERMHKDNLTAPNKIEPAIPNNVNIALLKALNLKSEERYQDIYEYINDLKYARVKDVPRKKTKKMIGIFSGILLLMVIVIIGKNTLLGDVKNINRDEGEVATSISSQDIGSLELNGNGEDSHQLDNSSHAIAFADNNLELAVRRAINKEEGILTQADVQSITELYVSKQNISNLDGIQYITELTRLELNQNEISDITFLSKLSRLGHLTLEGNNISDIEALGELTNLTELSLYMNSIEDISPIANLKYLTWLNISGNKVEDITPLKELNRIAWISMTNNDIEDITPVESMIKLESIAIDDNKIKGISSLALLPELESISVANNYISDISAIGALENLIWLNVGNNDITDFSVLDDLDLEFVNIELNP